MPLPRDHTFWRGFQTVGLLSQIFAYVYTPASGPGNLCHSKEPVTCADEARGSPHSAPPSPTNHAASQGSASKVGKEYSRPQIQRKILRNVRSNDYGFDLCAIPISK